MKLIYGKKIAGEILKKLKYNIRKAKIKPCLAVILVGSNSASRLYTKLKAKAARKVGIGFFLFKFSAEVQEKEILKLIDSLNADKNINGIIVQLPLPAKLNTDKIISKIDPMKDADGFHPKNIRRFLERREIVEPVFPQAIMKLIKKAKVRLAAKKAVIIANSEIFGQIMREMLSRQKIDSQIVLFSELANKKKKLKQADIIITATGRPGLLKGSMIRENAIVIDGGITRKKGKTTGDVDFDTVTENTGWLSPVPGGVGPVTVACLLENVYKLAIARRKKKF